MAARQSTRKPAHASSSTEQEAVSLGHNASDNVRGIETKLKPKGTIPVPSGVEDTPPPPVLTPHPPHQYVGVTDLANLEKRLTKLLEQRLVEQTAPTWDETIDESAPKYNDRNMSDEVESVWQGSQESECSSDVVNQAKNLQKRARSSSEASEVSEGDEYTKARKKANAKHANAKPKKTKKNKKKRKHASTSSSSSSDSSSEVDSDSDTNHKGLLAKELDLAAKKRPTKPDKKVRLCTLLRTAVEGHLHTFKPAEVILRGSEKFTGVKGIEASSPKEMDLEVPMSDEKKKVEHIMYTTQRAILAAMTAILPVANRMLKENTFTSLASDLNKGIELLAAASTFLSYRRYENVFKAVTTEAGKEITRSKKVKDKNGKEFTLFLAPKPIKGKTLDKSKMFGGQIPALLKQVESGSKCGRQMAHTGKREFGNATARGRQSRGDFRRRQFRGGRQQFGQFRGRGQARATTNWSEHNRNAQPFRNSQTAAQGKHQGFPRGGTK